MTGAAPALPVISIDRTNAFVCGVPVEWGPVPTHLPNPSVANVMLEADDQQVLVRLRSARMLVEAAGRVTVEPRDEWTGADLDFLLYGWIPSLLMMFRGLNFLHASVATHGGFTIALASHSGGGKSTAATELVARGWSLCIDDSAPVHLRGGGPWVIPYERPSHLTADAAERLGAHWRSSAPLPGREKVAVDLAQDLTPRPLDAIVILEPYEPGSSGSVPGRLVTEVGPVVVHRLRGADSLIALRRLLHVNHAALTPGRMAPTLRWLEALANLPVVVVARPRGESTEDAVATAILELVGSLKGDPVVEQIGLDVPGP
jgi:hypothetical protein